MFDMRRREFITLLGGAAAAWPLGARAQQPAVPVIGFLNIGSSRAFSTFLAAFHQGLNSTGYIEARNVAIEYRWADGDFDLLRVQANDLVRRNVTLIVATGGLVVARVAKDATHTIPLIFVGGGYPVEEGLVTSFNRPGGNATGVILLSTELISKRLELLHELVPKASRYAAILNPNTPGTKYERPDLERVRQQVGIPLSILEASTESDLKKVFELAPKERVEALVVSNDGFFASRRTQIIQLAAHHRLPAIYGAREFIVAGGLMSYGPNIGDAYRQAGEYVGRVLNGAKPADMPVQQPTKFDLAMNLKTAKALGLTVPPMLLARADEVIE